MSTSPLMTAAEVEDLIRRPRGTIKQWVCRRQMPIAYLKIRGKIMLRRDTVEAWLGMEIPPYTKPPRSTTPPATATATSSGTAPKRRGRRQRVPDLARQAQAAQAQH